MEAVLLQVTPVTLPKVKLSIGVFITRLSCVSSFRNVKFTKVLDTNSNPVHTNKIKEKQFVRVSFLLLFLKVGGGEIKHFKV